MPRKWRRRERGVVAPAAERLQRLGDAEGTARCAAFVATKPELQPPQRVGEVDAVDLVNTERTEEPEHPREFGAVVAVGAVSGEGTGDVEIRSEPRHRAFDALDYQLSGCVPW